MLLLKISLLLLSVTQGLAQTCPTTQCSCEQVQGNLTIICSYRRLQAVPVFDESETLWKSILLDDNDIVDIPADAFRNIKVQVIDLSDNKITSVSESAFSGLENTLEKVDLSNNKLPNLTDQLFQNFQKLKVLQLTSNSLSSIPPDVTTLEELYLGDNQFSPLSENLISGLSNLRKLGLRKNELSDIPVTFFSSTSNLEVLDLSENKFANFTEGVFANLKQLKQLSLYKNSLTVDYVDFLKEFRNSMEDLNIAYNNLNRIEQETFADFNKLVKLDLQFNQIVSINKESMSGFSNLEWFSIYGNRLNTIADDTFEATPHLEDLNFGINYLGAIPTAALQPLTKLKRLTLWANRINQVGEDDLNIPATGIEYVNLGNNPFPTLPAGLFSKIRGLRYFDCSSGQLTNLPDSLFNGMDRLYGLNLGKNSFTSIPTNIKNIVGLQNIDLSENNINDMKGDEFPEREFSTLEIDSNPLAWLPQKIFQHPYMSTLGIANINITGVGYICEALGNEKLRRMYLENNPLHCDCEILWLRQRKAQIARFWAQATCASPPPLAGKIISQLDTSEFNCTETIEQRCPNQNKATAHFSYSLIFVFLVCQSLAYVVKF